MTKAIAALLTAALIVGCTIDKVTFDVHDMNSASSYIADEAPPKPAVRMTLGWMF